jgi:hypothetical protein
LDPETRQMLSSPRFSGNTSEHRTPYPNKAFDPDYPHFPVTPAPAQSLMRIIRQRHKYMHRPEPLLPVDTHGTTYPRGATKKCS